MNGNLEAVQNKTVNTKVMLAAWADELHSLVARVEVDKWRIAELLNDARQLFGKDFNGYGKWTKQHTGYTVSHATQMALTFAKFGKFEFEGNDKKAMPFSHLTPLAAKGVSDETVKKVVEQLASDNRPTRDKVRQIVRDAAVKPDWTPEQKEAHARKTKVRLSDERKQDLKHAVSVGLVNPDFEGRYIDEFNNSGYGWWYYMLDLHHTASNETVKLVAKYWKHKYHPDKGGDQEKFDRVSQAEKIILDGRGGK